MNNRLRGVMRLLFFFLYDGILEIKGNKVIDQVLFI